MYLRCFLPYKTQVKELVYENPYENDKQGYNLEGFKLVDTINCTNQVVIDDNASIKALWEMTPYAFKTSKEDSEKINQLESIKVTTDFLISIYQKVG